MISPRQVSVTEVSVAIGGDENDYFGSMTVGMAPLCRAGTGGDERSGYYRTSVAAREFCGAFFPFYLGFILVLLNVLTGMIVDNDQTIADGDEDALALASRRGNDGITGAGIVEAGIASVRSPNACSAALGGVGSPGIIDASTGCGGIAETSLAGAGRGRDGIAFAGIVGTTRASQRSAADAAAAVAAATVAPAWSSSSSLASASTAPCGPASPA